MKHNVNFGLLGLLLLVLVAMILLVLYYYTTYEGLSAKYDDALANLGNASRRVNETQMALAAREDQLHQKEKELGDYLSQLNISQQRESKIGDSYKQVETKANDLSKNLNQTIGTLKECKGTLDQCTVDRENFKDQYQRTSNDLNTANNRVSQMKSDVGEVGSQVSMFGDELNSFKERLNRIDSNAQYIRDNRNNQTIVSDRAGAINSDVDSMMNTMTALESQYNRLVGLVNSIRGA